MPPLTVLIVDDDLDMRLYVRSCLRGLGSRVGHVLEAADGLEGIALARSGAVGLVIADVVLPRLDGYDLCRAIKEDPGLRHVGVLMISGEDDGPSAQSRADGFLAKPFNARQLEDSLQELLLRLPRPPPEIVD